MKRYALLLTVLAACSKDNPYYCDETPCETSMPDAPGATGCTSSEACPVATPVCDLAEATCVACTATDVGACAGTTPVCATATNTCTACVAHDECSSDACLPTGACGTDANVAYVATGGADTGTCTKSAPCATITYAAGQRPYVKVQNMVTEAVTLTDRNVTILGEGGTVVRNTTGTPVITIAGTSTVVLKDLVIRDATGTVGHGISVGNGQAAVRLTLEDVAVLNNAANGLSVLDGELTMNRCLVSGNSNTGAKIDALFNITSSIFVENGSGLVAVGGLSLTPHIGTNVFAFNTVATNHSSTSSQAYSGIHCTMQSTISSSIISNNQATGCMFEYSLFDASVTVTGTNKAGNPQFKNTDGITPLAADYYRIANNSDAIDSAAPTSTVMTDIDGDARPQGGARDIGADEYK